MELVSYRFYHIWLGMRRRCKTPSNKGYKYYGGRGIRICRRWDSFKAFTEDMFQSYLDHAALFGECNTSLDRVKVDGNYKPSNCLWATWSLQAANKRASLDKKHLSLSHA
jgi:hypothetical protein